MLGDLRPGGPERCPLFDAAVARKRADQDAMLLANRIRLLRAEEERARKKIRETEKRTQEIVQLRRRNEQRHLEKDAEQSRREVEERDVRLQQLRERDEQHRKMQQQQRIVSDRKSSASVTVKQDRELHGLQIEEARKEAAAVAADRHQRVQAALAAASTSRARSEDAKKGIGRVAIEERMMQEQDAAREKQLMIAKMEQEEADLLKRLQNTQEKHRVAYEQLEDVLRHNPDRSSCQPSSASASCRSSSTPLPSTPSRSLVGDEGYPQFLTELGSTPGSASGRRSAGLASGQQSSGSRPPRPRRPPVPQGPPMASGPATAEAARAVSDLPAPKVPAAGKRPAATPPHRSTSSCSTASCRGGSDSVQTASGLSSPASCSSKQITYTTVDGVRLDIPAEDDLDLAAMLNGL